MTKNYQTTVHAGRITPKKPTIERPAAEAALRGLPDTVSIAIADLAGELEEGLLAFAVGTGLKLLDVLLDEEATALAGPRGRHNPERTAVRHGSDDGLVTLGGRQVSITRPRLRSADRTSEVQLPTYAAASSTELLGRQAVQKMLAKLSTRRYAVGLEPVGTAVEERSQGTSKSAVSRRFVAMTECALEDLMAADLSAADLVVVMVEGVNFASHCCVVALGIDVEGNKIPLALVEGGTENATVVKRLLVGLRERGLDVTKPTLFVIDGSKALPPAIKAVFDHPVVARCQGHKVRNVRRHLSDKVGVDRGKVHALGVSQPRPARGPGPDGGAGDRARALPPRSRRIAARGTRRDLHRGASWGVADARPDRPVHEPHRVDDRDLS